MNTTQVADAVDSMLSDILGSRKISDLRTESVRIAIQNGADRGTIEAIRDATLVARRATIVIPTRYLLLSRGRGWARQGRGPEAIWGKQDGFGFRVGAGEWTVFSSDGFSRDVKVEWSVRHINVGTETWSLAD